MSDDGTLHGLAQAAHALNQRSQPLGYAVTMAAGAELGTPNRIRISGSLSTASTSP